MSSEQEPTTEGHYLHQRHVSPGGFELEGGSFSKYGTADDALKERAVVVNEGEHVAVASELRLVVPKPSGSFL